MEGIPTLVVVTKEGKLLTDEGDEQVSVRLIAIFSRLVLLILIFVFGFYIKSNETQQVVPH